MGINLQCSVSATLPVGTGPMREVCSLTIPSLQHNKQSGRTILGVLSQAIIL